MLVEVNGRDLLVIEKWVKAMDEGPGMVPREIDIDVEEGELVVARPCQNLLNITMAFHVHAGIFEALLEAIV